MKTSQKRRAHLELAREKKKQKQSEVVQNEENEEIFESEEESDEKDLVEHRSAGRPRKPYSDLEFKRRARKEAWDSLRRISGGNEADTELLLLDMMRAYIPRLYEEISAFTNLSQDISSVFQEFNEDIRGTKVGSLIAGGLTKDMSLKSAAEITGYSTTSLFYARKKEDSDSAISSAISGSVIGNTAPSTQYTYCNNFNNNLSCLNWGTIFR